MFLLGSIRRSVRCRLLVGFPIVSIGHCNGSERNENHSDLKNILGNNKLNLKSWPALTNDRMKVNLQ
jgi:hypothetical protein